MKIPSCSVVKCCLAVLWSLDDQMGTLTGVTGTMLQWGTGDRMMYWDSEVWRWVGVLNLPAVCKRGRILMRLKQTNGVREGERGGERRRARSRWQWAGGGNGGGEREINGMRKLITSIVVPQLLVEGIVEERTNEKRERGEEENGWNVHSLWGFLL